LEVGVRIARKAHVVSFTVQYHDFLAFKYFVAETKYAEFTEREYVEISIGDV
jgi:hypothetical protein